jgi:predicted enzyme related to lactoylglutathione lyase
MTETAGRPTGVSKETMPIFAKLFVHDLEGMANFYEESFGIVRFFRHQAVMLGRPIDEIGFQAGYPGGLELTLIKYLDSTGPSTGEAVLGFTTTDLQALIARAKVAGGSVPEPAFRIDEFGIEVVFVRDPEGHVCEVVQLDAAPVAAMP